MPVLFAAPDHGCVDDKGIHQGSDSPLVQSSAVRLHMPVLDDGTAVAVRTFLEVGIEKDGEALVSLLAAFVSSKCGKLRMNLIP